MRQLTLALLEAFSSRCTSSRSCGVTGASTSCPPAVRAEKYQLNTAGSVMSFCLRSWYRSRTAISSTGSQMLLQRTIMPRKTVSVRAIQLSLSGPDFSSTMCCSSALAAEKRIPLCSPS